jgi:hypothetical protein
MVECQLTAQELEVEVDLDVDVDADAEVVKVKVEVEDGEGLEIEGCLCGDPTTWQQQCRSYSGGEVLKVWLYQYH